METEVRIKFFHLHRCGYYRRHSSHASYGEKSDILKDMVKWIDGKSISETATYEPSDEQDANILNTYCYNLVGNTRGDFLLTTWNETATTDGAVASVSLTGTVGEASISNTEIQEGFLPGYPAYFWFPAGLDVYATIQIRNRLNGRHNLEEYFKAFLAKFSRFVVLDTDNDEDDEEQVLGYSSTGKAEDIDRSRPSFKSSEYRKNRKNRNIEFITNHREDIRKLVRRDVLTFNYSENPSLWQVLWRNVSGQASSPTLSGEHNLQFEIDFSPDESQLTQVIRQWESERDEDGSSNRFQDIGFKMSNDQRTHWLSKSLASDLFNLDLGFTRPPVANAAVLLSQLRRRSRQILPLLDEEVESEEVNA